MVFNSTAVLLFLGVGIIWLGIVSYLLLRMIRHYNTLTKDISDHGLKSILEQILKRQQTIIRDIDQLHKDLDLTKHEGSMHLQKAGFVRFNSS